MPMIELADGAKIAYDVTGHGPPLVFLHCWTGDRTFYFLQVMHFSDRYRCITLDFPGHGDSPAQGDYSVERFGEITIELLEELGVDEAVFAGHSLGGMVALHLALDYPEMVKGLILLDTTSHLSAFFFQKWFAVTAVLLGAVGYGLRNNGWTRTKGFVAAVAACHPLTGPGPRFISARECSRVQNYAMVKTLNSVRNFNATDRLPEIDVPALIVVGEADLLADIRHARRMHKGIKDSILKLVRGAGHMALFERPEVVNEAMDEFLSDVYPPAKKRRAVSKKKVPA
jgi:3-oxoadipate enol-lactonase